MVVIQMKIGVLKFDISECSKYHLDVYNTEKILKYVCIKGVFSFHETISYMIKNDIVFNCIKNNCKCMRINCHCGAERQYESECCCDRCMKFVERSNILFSLYGDV